MSVFSDAARDAALRGLVGDNNNTAATLYVGVASGTPAVDETGVITGLTEVTGGGYARVAVANTDSEWDVTAGVASNVAEVAFPEATADWPAVTVVIVCDAATSGNVLAAGTLGGSTTVLEGQTLRFLPGTITLTHLDA